MKQDCTRALQCALLGATLAAVLGGCAMAGQAQPPGVVSEPPYGEDESHKKLKDSEPQTIAAWEARIQSHGALLYTLVHGSGGASAPPTDPTPTRPTPRTRPYRRQSAHPSPPPTRATTGASASARQPIRCRRICRTVRAICYAAKRICQIAARIDSESARAACQRNQKTCRSARNISTRRGCIACGYAKRSRTNKTRRACLWFDSPLIIEVLVDAKFGATVVSNLALVIAET